MKRVLSLARRTLNTPRHTAYAILGFLVVCAMAYALLEGKGPIEGLWWGIVTASTVGYGDYSPESTPGRFFGATLILSMWVLNLAAQAHVNKKAMDDPDAWTHDEQNEARLCDDETNHLVKHLIVRLYGQAHLDEVLDEFHTNRKEPSA